MSTNTNKTKIRVQLIDPHQITLWGVQQLLTLDKRFEICAVASNAVEALKFAANSKPDLIVLEPDLQDESGLALISALLELTPAKILIFTGNTSSKVHDQLIAKGARGVIHKTETIDNLAKAIEKIHQGELWLNHSAASRILKQITQPPTSEASSSEWKKLAALTSKEDKVTRAIQMYPEKTLKQVAVDLHISEHTLRNHLASIYNKLGVRNRMELYVFCGKYQKTNNPELHPKRRSTDI